MSIKFLEDQLREVDERADNAERDVAKMEILAQEYRTEVSTWNKKTQTIRDEVKRER